MHFGNFQIEKRELIKRKNNVKEFDPAMFYYVIIQKYIIERKCLNKFW